MGYCRKCKGRWTGLSRSHCSDCHRTFKSAWGFDKHRVRFKCLDPVDLRMEINERGIWFVPMPKTVLLSKVEGQNSRL